MKEFIFMVMLPIITSILLSPEGNDHFRELISKYKSFLNPGMRGNV